MPCSYPITTTHIESPPHIWDDFVGALLTSPIYWHSWGFAPAPFEKSQLIQLL
jgi:hypothetical protein